MKNKVKYSSLLFILASVAQACEVCQSQQPKLFQGWTHGTGPDGKTDFIIVVVAAIIVLFTLILSIKFLVRPGEKHPNHIKNIVIEKTIHHERK